MLDVKDSGFGQDKFIQDRSRLDFTKVHVTRQDMPHGSCS